MSANSDTLWVGGGLLLLHHHSGDSYLVVVKGWTKMRCATPRTLERRPPYKNERRIKRLVFNAGAGPISREQI
jgi:hypothetical protein